MQPPQSNGHLGVDRQTTPPSAARPSKIKVQSVPVDQGQFITTHIANEAFDPAAAPGAVKGQSTPAVVQQQRAAKSSPAKISVNPVKVANAWANDAEC